jgi:hypothetical protein
MISKITKETKKNTIQPFSLSLVFLFTFVYLSTSQEVGEFILTFNTIPIGNVNHASASEQLKQTIMGVNGISYLSSGTNEQLSAIWLSEVTGYPNGTFSEQGNITIGVTANIIFFQSRVLGTSQNGPGFSYGSISYEIIGGRGSYNGAKGWMVDTFIAFDDEPSFNINAWGWFYVPSGQTKSPAVPIVYLPKSSPQKLLDRETTKAEPQRIEFACIFNNNPQNGVNHAIAGSQYLSTTITPKSVYVTQTPLDVSTLLNWTSVPVSYPNGTFSNSGTIELINSVKGTLASISFQSSSLGQARNGPNNEYGGITYWIGNGTGLWEGAQGTMIDMFISPDNSQSNPILVWAVFWIL